jgi:hypothetical protein
MTEEDIRIKTIQFKRGHKKILEAKLVASDLGIPLAGEPIFESDTGQLKIGDGINSYIDLPYVSSKEGIPNFILKDPLSNQVLLYDENLQA